MLLRCTVAFLKRTIAIAIQNDPYDLTKNLRPAEIASDVQSVEVDFGQKWPALRWVEPGQGLEFF